MNNLRDKSYGIDKPIQEIQTQLHEFLETTWSTKKLDAYGRVYRNVRDKQVLPEVYVANEKQYREVYYNNQSCFFFVETGSQPGDGFSFTAPVRIVFMLNLNHVLTGELERADEIAFTDVVRHLRESYEGLFSTTRHVKGIEDSLKGFYTEKLVEDQNDMQPLHVFGVEGIIEYFINDKCN